MAAVVRSHLHHFHVSDDRTPLLGRCDDSLVFNKKYLADAAAKLLNTGWSTLDVRDMDAQELHEGGKR